MLGPSIMVARLSSSSPAFRGALIDPRYLANDSRSSEGVAFLATWVITRIRNTCGHASNVLHHRVTHGALRGVEIVGLVGGARPSLKRESLAR
jgi:hypothetical protein